MPSPRQIHRTAVAMNELKAERLVLQDTVKRLQNDLDALAEAVVGIDYRSPEDRGSWTIDELVKQANRARTEDAAAHVIDED